MGQNIERRVCNFFRMGFMMESPCTKALPWVVHNGDDVDMLQLLIGFEEKDQICSPRNASASSSIDFSLDNVQPAGSLMIYWGFMMTCRRQQHAIPSLFLGTRASNDYWVQHPGSGAKAWYEWSIECQSRIGKLVAVTKRQVSIQAEFLKMLWHVTDASGRVLSHVSEPSLTRDHDFLISSHFLLRHPFLIFPKCNYPPLCPTFIRLCKSLLERKDALLSWMMEIQWLPKNWEPRKSSSNYW